MSKSLFLPQSFIAAKRDNKPLNLEDIDRFVAGIKDGSVSEGQVASFAMAVYFNGMADAEAGRLTTAMRDSGDVINWTNYGFEAGAPIVDKHSTGGVGDKVSIMLAPIVAAAGGFVPMISGRGLGHTGGTLDKLEGIPGYETKPSLEGFAKTVREVGCSIIGQTGQLAPADKRFYAIRDVTATVESIPLITASILSKKLAAGLGSLVMDVKFGTGAFMADRGRAQALARSIVRVAKETGTPITALITDMNEVLGRTAGNNVEMWEAIDFLMNPSAAEERLASVTLDLAGHMLALSGVSESFEAGREKADAVWQSGAAAEVFARMVVHQGGPADLMQAYKAHMQVAKKSLEVTAPVAGVVTAIDVKRIGMAVVALGGGRTDPTAAIDHSVGLTNIKGRAVSVERGEVLAVVHGHDSDSMAYVASEVAASFVIGDAAAQGPVVVETLS